MRLGARNLTNQAGKQQAEAGPWCRRACVAARLAFVLATLFACTRPMQAAEPTNAASALPTAQGVARVFTEARENPIRPAFGMPDAWRARGDRSPPSFEGAAQPGEFFVFQIGIQALKDLGPLAVSFDALERQGGAISADAIRCLSLGGTDEQGRAFHKSILVPEGTLQVLWVGVEVPLTARGSYAGTARVRLNAEATVPVLIRLTVTGAPLKDHGDSVAKKLSRLRWLDSVAGSEPTVTAPFVPVRTTKSTVIVLGRELVLGKDGLPAQIVSHFSPANTMVEKDGRALLAEPMAFVTETEKGRVQWRSKLVSLQHSGLSARWQADSRSDELRLETTGTLDFTGSGEVRLRLTAERDVELKDARLETLFRPDTAAYFMGLNRPGGRCPETLRWKWDVSKRQDCFWLGDVNAGLMLRFKDENYLRPPVNIYYSFRPLRLPVSWGNGTNGGVNLDREKTGAVSVAAYSGPRRLQRGESLEYIFELYLTPFRTIDTDKQWATRFIHPHPSKDPNRIDEIVATADASRGPNVVNVHQATYYNPYINYPFNDDSFPAFCDLVKRAHQRRIRVRAYYTTREITQNMPELLPLHSFNGEIILPGPGKDARTLIHPDGPHPWLVEHLGDGFVPAWVDHVGGKYAELDLSVCTTPDSRWNNFYLEGLKWMVDKSDFDGIYVDDTALDASSLRRARRILDGRRGRLIDFHSWNHFNGAAGYANNLTIYMELLPYLDRLWLGEGFNAQTVSADYWLVEMSGIPFGLMSEMLDGVQPWRGLLFGETGRLGWAGDPREVWRVWDEYGIRGTEFLPFFARNCPVKTGNANVLATVYRRDGRSLIALASWADREVTVDLAVDWKALGLDPAKVTLRAPAMKGFQSERIWKPGEPIVVPPNQGWFLVVK